MKKALITIFALAGLSGCVYYDYYKGGVRYTQDGEDCIYYAGEAGNNFSGEISDLNNSKKIVYRNTRCADLYARDNFGQAPRHDRQILVPAAKPCNACCGQVQPCAKQTTVVKRRYVIVPAM